MFRGDICFNGNINENYHLYGKSSVELTRGSTKSLWRILKVEGRGEVYKMFRHIDAPSFLFMPIAAYRCLTLGPGGGFCLNIKYYFVCFLLKLDFYLFSILMFNEDELFPYDDYFISSKKAVLGRIIFNFADTFMEWKSKR